MSDGKEVKRWNINLGDHEEGLYEIESSNGEWIKASDHDRVVAKLSARCAKLEVALTEMADFDNPNEPERVCWPACDYMKKAREALKEEET